MLFVHANTCFAVCCALAAIHSYLNILGQQTNQFWLHMHFYTCLCLQIWYSHRKSISALFYSCTAEWVTQVACGNWPPVWSDEDLDICNSSITCIFSASASLTPYDTQTAVQSILKVGMIRKYQRDHGCFQCFSVSINGRDFQVSCTSQRWGYQISSPFTWGYGNFGNKDGRVRSSIWI